MSAVVTWATPLTRAERSLRRAEDLLERGSTDDALVEIETAKRELTTATTFIVKAEREKREKLRAQKPGT